MNQDSISAHAETMLNRTADKYAEKEWLPPLLQLVPFGVGSAIDSVLGNRATDIQIKRLSEFLRQVSERLAIIDEHKLDRQFFKTEDFYFHCRNVFRLASSERQIEKLKYFADMFIRGICLPRPSQDLMEVVSGTLGQMTESDINALHRIWSIAAAHASKTTPYKNRENRREKVSTYLQSGIEKDFPGSATIIRQHLLNNGLIEMGFWNEGEYSGMTLSSYGTLFIKTLLRHEEKQKDA